MDTAYVFADVANIRKSPDSGAEVVARIPIGTPVIITKITKKTATVKGLTAPWLKMRNDSIEGYVWAGTLTNAALTLEDGSQVVWGLIEKQESEELLSVRASVRIASEGVLRVKTDFELKHADRPEDAFLSVLPAPLLNGVRNVVMLETLSEACGVFASVHYLLYTGEELYFVDSGWSMGDGGLLHTVKSYAFPYPAKENASSDYHYEPDPEHVLCIENTGEYDEECVWVETYKVKDFVWKENQLERFCNE